MATKVGFECVLYRNTGSYGSPTWNEVPNVKDATLTLTRDKVDASTRGTASGTRWKAFRGTLKDGTITFTMLWDNSDADFQAFLDAWQAGTTIEVLALSGPVATTGEEGLRAICEVFKVERGEPLNDMVTANIEMGPSANNGGNEPSWYVVP